jgi:hypothetical protein
MTENKALQWAAMIVPTAIAIMMAIMTFSNRTTTLSATTLEKVLQMEKEVEEIKGELDDLDESKVDKDTFKMLIDRLDRIDTNIDKLKDKS